ncbi:methyltransferase domain-containing protein [Pannus brasiliensis CCIBt3594]|uniref:Methyltransferase domain-containing protein n=1 Tax=Pannus brasiliensis CCIBt3594 TaxID=1427578 RepID=A0AAW9QR96_9CHRO
MNGSTLDYLNVVAPYLADELISPRARAYLRTIARNLPCYPIGGLECRLSGEDDRVDLLAYVPRGPIEIPANAREHPVWKSLEEFGREWSDPDSLLSKKVGNLSLEFDLDREPSRILIPGIFLALDRESFFADDGWTKLLDRWPFDSLFPAIDPSLLESNLQRCIRELPRTAWIAHLGTLLSRPARSLRIVIKDIPPDDVPDYLVRIGWSDRERGTGELVSALSRWLDRVTLALDVGETIAPAIGLECRIETPPSQDSRWSEFLDYLVVRGICTPAKQKALLAWPGITRKTDRPDLWPESLRLGDLFAGPNALSFFYRNIYHLKITYQPARPLTAKAYLEFGHRWLDRRWLERATAIANSSPEEGTAIDPASYRQQVLQYYERFTPIILKNIGRTYQAGLLIDEADQRLFERTNVYCASRAGIRPGDRVLDAGCGVCGPSIDIARSIEGVTIDAITLSPLQARSARQFIEESGLSDRIRVHVGDFHELPFEGETFDRVIFLEAAGYSYAPDRLYREVYRVLRPGGWLYLKEPFIKEATLSTLEQKELAEFNRVYVCRAVRASEAVIAIAAAGFEEISSYNSSDVIGAVTARSAMFEEREGKRVLTEFGQYHYRNARCLPIVFGEITARKPFRDSSVT